MGIHKSLKQKKASKRSVNKRWERLRSLILQQKWDREHNSIYKLPKEKIVKIKIKKEKKEKKDETLTEYAERIENEKK